MSILTKNIITVLLITIFLCCTAKFGHIAYMDEVLKEKLQKDSINTSQKYYDLSYKYFDSGMVYRHKQISLCSDYLRLYLANSDAKYKNNNVELRRTYELAKINRTEFNRCDSAVHRYDSLEHTADSLFKIHNP